MHNQSSSTGSSGSDTTQPPGLRDKAKKDLAMRLVSAAENSSLCWKDQFGYIEYNVEGNESDNRGYTGGIVGFTSKTGDMLKVVQLFEKLSKKANSPQETPLTKYIKPLEKANGSPSQKGLELEFEDAWRKCDRADKYRDAFREAQMDVRDEDYFEPAVKAAQNHGPAKLGTLGQFIYYDAWVMHGGGDAVAIQEEADKATDKELEDLYSFVGARLEEMRVDHAWVMHDKDSARTIWEKAIKAKDKEVKYLYAFLGVRLKKMCKEVDHRENVDRVINMQLKFLEAGNLNLDLPLEFEVNKEQFKIPS